MTIGNRIRFGFLGVGRRGLEHLKAASSFKDVSIEAFYSRDQSRLRDLASNYGARVYTDLDEMLEKEKLDVAVISTPTMLHVPQALKCLGKGLDVVLEKPISLDISEVMELLKAVEKSDRIVIVGLQGRYSEITGRIVENVDRDTLSMLAGCWYWSIPLVRWISIRSQGGGQILDQAIHLIDMARFIVDDEVEKVCAIYTDRGRDTKEDRFLGFDNWASYITSLKFENNAIGVFYSSYALYPGVLGSKESASFMEDKATRESSAFMDIICRDLLIRYIHPSEIRVYRKGKETEIYKSTENSTSQMYRAFIEAVVTRDESILRTRYKDSYKTTAVCLAANESAITGKPIDLNEFTAKYNHCLHGHTLRFSI